MNRHPVEKNRLNFLQSDISFLSLSFAIFLLLASSRLSVLCQEELELANVWPLAHIGVTIEAAAVQCDQIGRFLQVLGNKLSHKSCPNILVIFGAISNNVTIMKKVCGYFLGNFPGKLDNFLFHHLVTLLLLQSDKKLSWDNPSGRISKGTTSFNFITWYWCTVVLWYKKYF